MSHLPRPKCPTRSAVYAGSVPDVICLDIPAGTRYVDRVRRAWDEGDAVFPLDSRLPAPAREAVLAAARPTVIVTADGERRVDGQPCDTGDALLVATSGTTGNPRVAMLSLDALQRSANAVADRLTIDAADRWFACLPLAHVGGFSVVARSLLLGLGVDAVERFSEDAYVAAARSGCTMTSLVPAALSRVDPSMYRTILLGGSAPPAERARNVIATYGMTETGGGVVYDGLALAGVDVAVDDEGQILLRCPMLMRCYRDGEMPAVEGPDGRADWYPTGDLGEIDPSGVLSVHGRRGDRINTGGEKVWPSVVEEALRSHPAVADVCVAGVDDPQWGQAVHAWVVPAPGKNLSLQDARTHVKEMLPPWCAPKALHLVTTIPRTALGKPRRTELVLAVRKASGFDGDDQSGVSTG